MYWVKGKHPNSLNTVEHGVGVGTDTKGLKVSLWFSRQNEDLRSIGYKWNLAQVHYTVALCIYGLTLWLFSST